MPCNSDHLEPHGYELEASRMYRLLDELDSPTGKYVDPVTFNDGMDKRAYGQALSKELMDALTAYLCARIKSLGVGRRVSDHSLELQMWWRDHQKVDAER